MSPINKTYFLFTVEMLINFFFITLMFVCIVKLYIYIEDESVVFTVSMKLRSIGPSDFKNAVDTGFIATKMVALPNSKCKQYFR